jgi:hypothetical protein
MRHPGGEAADGFFLSRSLELRFELFALFLGALALGDVATIA